MAKERNRILSNILGLPWSEDRTEAMRIYMQIYRSRDPQKKIEEILRLKGMKKELIYVATCAFIIPLWGALALPNLLLLGLC